jgi:type I restriction enzyme S subunit
MRAKVHPPGTIIFPKIGGAIATNKRRILTKGSAIDNNCLGITFANELNVEWAFLLLTTLDFTRYQAGTAVPALQQGVLERIPVGLPPLAEQHRIVAKVDELMGLCDRVEAARAGREATRDRLAAASLARLNAPDPETFTDDARFALDALQDLTTRPDQIKALRQTILNLAVRGQLVPQDAKDEPASELLKRIGKEKARLLKQGEIRKEKALPPVSDDDKFFDLPSSWSWIRLGDLSQLVKSGSRDWAQHYSTEGAIFVRMGNLSKDHYRLRLDHIQRVKPPSDGEGTRTRLEAGDILISITGDVGMLGLIPDGFGEAYINQHTAMVRPIAEMKGRYLAELFRSPFAQEQFNEPQRGIKNSFRLTDVTQFVVPLPPLAEQHRIVAKVDALMALCDRLEASLTATAATRRRLLDALLAEALTPDAERELEAAE